MTTATIKLTKSEKRLLDLLRETGPLSYPQMRYGYGNRAWTRIFHRLRRKKLACYDVTEEAHRTAKFYAAVKGLQPEFACE